MGVWFLGSDVVGYSGGGYLLTLMFLSSLLVSLGICSGRPRAG